MRVVRELLRGRPALVVVVGCRERVIRDLPVVVGIRMVPSYIVFICHRVVVVRVIPRVVIEIADDVHGAIVISVGMVRMVGMVGIVGIVGIVGMVGMVVMVGMVGVVVVVVRVVGMLVIDVMTHWVCMMSHGYVMVRVVLWVGHRRNAVHRCHFLQTLCGLHLQQEAADVD